MIVYIPVYILYLINLVLWTSFWLVGESAAFWDEMVSVTVDSKKGQEQPSGSKPGLPFEVQESTLCQR